MQRLLIYSQMFVNNLQKCVLSIYNLHMYARVETDKTKEGTRHEKEIWYLQV